MAIEIEGNWNKGLAIDVHTLASHYLGTDKYGHELYETQRSPIGELVYKLKYRSQTDVIPQIIEHTDQILGLEEFDYIIPVPASKSDRTFQPVTLIAKALGEKREVQVLENYLIKSGNAEELKNVTNSQKREKLLRDTLIISAGADISGKSILVVDDLYRSGSTLRAVTELLYNEANVSVVCVLTMTKTRVKR